jgi:hypothetical protein
MEDTSVEGKITLTFILRRSDGRVWIGFNWFGRERPVADCCEHGNELMGFTKFWELVQQLSN